MDGLMDNPTQKWMRTGGTPISGNLHMSTRQLLRITWQGEFRCQHDIHLHIYICLYLCRCQQPIFRPLPTAHVWTISGQTRVISYISVAFEEGIYWASYGTTP